MTDNQGMPLPVRLTLARRALEAAELVGDPRIESIKSTEREMALALPGTPMRGGGLPAGPNVLGLVAAQMVIARAEIQGVDAVSNVSGTEAAMVAAVPAMSGDAEGAKAVRDLACGSDRVSLRLRELVKGVGPVCAP